MVVYIEYAFIENLLLDSLLLYLALKGARQPVSGKRILLSASIGSLFSLLFPLISLPKSLSLLLKISVGFLLVFLAVLKVKTKKEWGRYGTTCVFFFVFTYFFGGVLTSLLQEFFRKNMPIGWVIIGFLTLTAISLWGIEKLYQKRAVYRFLYDCKIFYRERQAFVRGFLDSGNLAIKKGLPVCFLSPDLFYELFETVIFNGAEGEEMQIQTVNGEKSCRVFQGEIEVLFEGEMVKKQVYFACASNMLSRGYRLILSGYLLSDSE